MAFNEQLAERIRELLEPGSFVERKMFGGLAFMVGGHMAVTVSGQGGLMVRSDEATAAELINSTPAEQVVMRGRPMTGWIRVPDTALIDDHDLERWVDLGLRHVHRLPPK